MKKLALAMVCCAAVTLTGCVSTSDPIAMGGGQYSISSTNFWAWSGEGQQADAAQAANEYCAKMGKVARITSMKATDAVAYRNVASGQVTFICEDPAREEEPVEMANGVYMLAGSSSGYQGIKARYALIKTASKFCAKQGLKVEPVDSTRESGVNLTSRTGSADTANSAENALQTTSADLLFRCKQ